MLTRSATTTSTLTADNGAAVDNLNNGGCHYAQVT